MSVADWRETFESVAFRAIRLLRLDRLLLLGAPSHPFLDYFRGFENVEAVKRIFGEKAADVLGKLKIDFIPFGGYMGVNPFNGHLMINKRYFA